VLQTSAAAHPHTAHESAPGIIHWLQLSSRSRSRSLVPPRFDVSAWPNNGRVERVEGEHDSPSTADVGPGYFRTVGIPLVAGREFTEADGTSAPKVAIVNESLVRTFGLGRGALGRRMGMGAGNVPIDIEIVGVAADARYSNLKKKRRRSYTCRTARSSGSRRSTSTSAPRAHRTRFSR
jgi:hypothetical protein